MAAARPPLPSPAPARADAPAASRPAVELPSADEIQAAYDAGRFDEVLRKLRLVLSLNGAAADPYDRHALLRLRGETLLRIGSGQQAASSFAEAAREASDPTAAATDWATGLLLRRTSAGAVYQPRARADGRGRPLAIDVLSPGSRKDALRAMFRDELAARRADVEAAAATDVRALDPIAPAVGVIRDLRALELAGTDDDREVAELVVGLDLKVASLLRTQVEATAQTVLDVEREATKLRAADGFYAGGQSIHDTAFRQADKQVGLIRGRAGKLRQAVAVCEATLRWCDACDSAFKGGGADFQNLREQAETSARLARAMLGHDWSQVNVRLHGDGRLGF